MKKLLGILVLGLLFCNVTLGQSSLPECEGNDDKISKFFLKTLKQMKTGKEIYKLSKEWKVYIREHYKLTRKWTKCQGTGMGPRGEKYVGEWKDGKFHGQGTFTHEGRKFVGEWYKGKKYGEGAYTYANGDKYVGKWIRSKYSKKGTYIYANGDKYIGDWKKKDYHVPDNQLERNGWGTYTYANGGKYVGKWKKGLRHGKGTFTHANGKIEKGIWKKGKLVK